MKKNRSANGAKKRKERAHKKSASKIEAGEGSEQHTGAGNHSTRQGNLTPEKRKDVRAPLDAPIWLRVLAASSPLLEGRIVNVSKKGFKLKLPEAIQPGVQVQARIGGKIVMAEVRYCLPHGAEFHIGVEIQDVFPIPGKSLSE